jgi:p-cumate 2,3-dioxygenase beta subunit
VSTTQPLPNAPSATRHEVEDFLYHEASLLEQWRLTEWLALLTDDAEYEIPATDSPDSDCSTTLALIYDDRERIAARVKQYNDDLVYAEVPRARIRRMVSNVRILEDGVRTLGEVHALANIAVYRFASQKMDMFIGYADYRLVRHDTSFRIRKRRIVLDLEALRPQCKLSIII